MFSSEQMSFLRRTYIARVATSSSKCVPHATPVYFANDSTSIFFATERSTRKLKDVLTNPVASAVVDEFKADWVNDAESSGLVWKTEERAVVINGRALVHSDGETPTYGAMYDALFEKYPDYRAQGWKKGESPIIQVMAERIHSWGI